MSRSTETLVAPLVGPSILSKVLSNRSLRDSTLLLVLAVIWLFFSFATNGTFLTQRNLVLLALQTAIVALAAISAVMLIVTRNFDLSVGSAVALIGVVVALLTVRADVDPVVAVLICLGVGPLMGAWQGWWVTRMKVSSFIVTLAGMLYFRGISMIATNGQRWRRCPPVSSRSRPASCRRWHRSSLLSPPSAYSPPSGFSSSGAAQASVSSRASGTNSPGRCCRRLQLRSRRSGSLRRKAFRILSCWVAICAIGADILMRRARFGVQLYAIGGNPEAARLSGINVERVIFINFVIAGLGYGITGIALTAPVSGAIAGSAGLFLELDAIAAAILAAPRLPAGAAASSALVGALLMGSLNNGMSLMNVPTFYQDTARGIVLLLAVAIDQLSRRRSGVVR